MGVVGFGRSGRAALRLLSRLGAKAFVSEGAAVDDLAPEVRSEAKALAASGIPFEFGGHGSLVGADLVVVSPGVAVETVRRAGYDGPIWGELELASRLLSVRPVAVTGTNGKTTVASLIAHILRAAHPDRKVHLRGNIGEALAVVADEVLPEDLVVLEVSSFQLDTAETFSPSVAVLLNIAPDHLDRYADLAAYAAAKERIFAHQREGDTAIVVVDDELSRAALARVPRGVRRVAVTCRGENLPPIGTCAGFVPEAHRRGAVEAAVAMGVPRAEANAALASFRPLPHRLEPVAESNGVRWINDSKATNFHAVVFALAQVPRPVVLLLGGRGKGEDPAVLLPHLEGVDRVVAFGEMRRSIDNTLGGHVPVTSVTTVEEAIDAAFNAADNIHSVLFSPGGSSFDAFRNYAERGDHFRAAVRRRLAG